MAMTRPEIAGRRGFGADTTIDPNGDPPLPEWAERRRIITLKEVARLTSLSVDTLYRRHADKIVHLSPRRCGMVLEVALTLTNNED
jgi:hypothetical protein